MSWLILLVLTDSKNHVSELHYFTIETVQLHLLNLKKKQTIEMVSIFKTFHLT